MAAQIVWLRSAGFLSLSPQEQQCSACGGRYPANLQEQELWTLFVEHCRDAHPDLLPTRTRIAAARRIA